MMIKPPPPKGSRLRPYFQRRSLFFSSVPNISVKFCFAKPGIDTIVGMVQGAIYLQVRTATELLQGTQKMPRSLYNLSHVSS